jgi:hypothetical protein
MKSVTDYEGELVKLKFVGDTQAIEGTATHPLFSEDRGDYVDMGTLAVGERVRTADGWAIVESLARRWSRETVYNIEVDGVHRYLVGEQRVVSHNAGPKKGCKPCPGDCGDGPKRPTTKTSLPDRVTKEMPPGQMRTVEENAQARNYFERNREAAREWWEQRTGREWPRNSTHDEHPRPLKDGGDPLFIEPGYGGPTAPHMIPGPDGLTDFQRWGRLGGRPKKTPS